MSINPDLVLRDTAIALVPMVGLAALAGGAMGALGAAVTGLIMLGNLFLLGRLIRRVTAYLAGNDPNGGLAVGLLVVKFPLLLGIITLLVWLFDGLSVGIGMGAMVFAIFIRGMVSMLQAPPEPEPTAPDATQGF